MGLAQSPKTVTNGLVFYYDQNNIKSYKGPAVQNLLTQITPTGYTATGISITTGSEIVNIPQIGDSQVQYSVIQNNYTSFTPNSADCCPRPFRYSGEYGAGGFVIQASTLYTYGIVYKVTSGYTHANYMYRYEFTSNGGSYVTEAGVHSDSNRIHLGDGWYWAWGTFTTQATTNWINLAGAWYYRYSDKSDKLSIAKVLMVKGDYTQLHPKYWPNVNTTRSSTATVLDLMGNNTISVTSLTYANTGAFTFSNNQMSTSTNISYGNNMTWEVWVKRTSSVNPYNMIMGRYLPYFGIRDANDVIFSNYVNATQQTMYSTGVTMNNNTWYHLAFTTSYDGTNTTAKIYINGVLNNTATQTGAQGSQAYPFTIGTWYPAGTDYPFNGSIDRVRVYNRTLTDTEISQNFNAQRSGYGI